MNTCMWTICLFQVQSKNMITLAQCNFLEISLRNNNLQWNKFSGSRNAKKENHMKCARTLTCLWTINLVFFLFQSKKHLRIKDVFRSRNSEEVHKNTWKILSLSLCMSRSQSLSLPPYLVSLAKWKPREVPSSGR